MTDFKRIFPIIFCFILHSCSKTNLDTDPKSTTSFTGNIDFVKTIGGSKNDVANAVISTSDNGYVIFGYTDSNDKDVSFKNNNDSDYYFLKYNSKDQLEWAKTYGGSKNDRGLNVVQTSDNGYAIFGASKSDDIDSSKNEGDADLWIIKLDTSGNLLWEKSFGFIGRDNGFSLIETSDNGFLIVGELDVSSSGGLGKSRSANRHAGGDYWAIKLNASGDKEWSNFFGGNFSETPQDVIETDTGDFIIVGLSDSNDVDITNNKGTYDFWIIKINNKGELVWEKSFGGSQIDEAYGITKTEDANFIIVGNTRSNDKNVRSNNGGSDLWVIKISTTGNLIWEKSFGGTNFDSGRAIHKSNNDGFIIVGSSRSTNNGFLNKGQNDAWLLKISSEGEKTWEKFIGGSQIDFLYDVTELKNGAIIAVGESTSNDIDIPENKGFSDVLVIKIK